MEFGNVYEDPNRAQSYAKLEFPATYYLAFRDLPEIIFKHVNGKRAIDFGCGAGRSTRFLKRYGFYTIGIDVSKEMVKMATRLDPAGDYRVIPDGDFGQIGTHQYDLVLAAFTFDNIPDNEHRVSLLRQLRNLLNNQGVIVLLVSAPEIYANEWASFTTKDFPGNKNAKSGDKVKIIMLDVEDKRPVEDVIWFDEDYRKVFRLAGVELVEAFRPLARGNEPYEWVSETIIAPWVIYLLK